MTDFVDDGDSVLVTVKDAEGNEKKYKTKYLVAADGGKTVGPKIGVEMQGPTGEVYLEHDNNFQLIHFQVLQIWYPRIFQRICLSIGMISGLRVIS